MSIENNMQDLRDLLYQQPSTRSWISICELFHQWPEDEGADIALHYAEDHMLHWPDHLRAAPGEWTMQLLSQQRPHAAWGLVRTVQFPKGQEQEVVRMLQSEHVAHITGLDLQRVQMSDSGLRRCFHSPYIAQVNALSLAGQSNMSWDTLEVLATTKVGKNLTRLDLSHTALINPQQGGRLRTDAFPQMTHLTLHHCNAATALLTHMRENPFWREHLTHLNISRSNILTSQLRAFADADFWQSITHLDLSDNDLHRGGIDTLFEILATHPITHLKLDRANMHTECFRGLRRSTTSQLTHLSLQSNRIDDRCLSLLMRLSALGRVEQLSLQYNPYTEKGIAKLITSPHLPNAAKMPYLESLSDGALKDLAQQLKRKHPHRISRFQLMDLLLQK